MRRRLRKALWSDRPLDEQSRDLRLIFDAIPPVEIREHEGLYQTGMTLRLDPGDGPPIAIELIRCTYSNSPDSAVAHGTAVSFRVKSQGAEITRIDGLTPDSDTAYRMTFRITYGAA